MAFSAKSEEGKVRKSSDAGRRSSENHSSMTDVRPTSPDLLSVPPPATSFGAFARKSADWSAQGSSTVRGNLRPQIELTIVIVGSTRVGKSAIVNQYMHGVFQTEYKETLDQMHWKEYDYSDPPNIGPSGVDSPTIMPTKKDKHQNQGNAGIFLLKIIDTVGSREFIGMRKLYEQQGDAFILVIAIDDPDSFEEAKVIRREIGERNRKNAPVIIALNKIDLRDTVEAKCPVDAEEVRKFCILSNSLFAEATATKYESVAEIFQQLLDLHASIPSTATLKYRRKSVPVSLSVNDFRFPAVPYKTTAGSPGSPSEHSSRDIPEEESEKVEQKRSSCKMS